MENTTVVWLGCFMKFNKYEMNLPRIRLAASRRTATGRHVRSRVEKGEPTRIAKGRKDQETLDEKSRC